MKRVRRPELMDQPDAAPAELERSLADVSAVSRWLGGRRTAVKYLTTMARRVPMVPVRVLDVGTGAADVPLALVAAARRQRLDIRVTGLDLHPTTVRYARAATVGDPRIEIVRADALSLPFADNEFDLSTCNTTLHHFSEDDALRVLRELERVARWGVVVTDLARSRMALIGSMVLARTVWRNHPITRHDGPWSVRAAFTPADMRELGGKAGWSRFEVRSEPVFRWSAVLDRTA